MSLDLDERQRAMLKEMGVTVWWPKTAPVTSVSSAVQPVLAAQAVVESVQIKSNSSDFKEINVRKSLENSTKKIANSAIEISIISQLDVNSVSEIDLIEKQSQLGKLPWLQLAQDAAGCRACKLCEGRTRSVFGSTGIGPESAPVVDWLIVGDVPGDAEDAAGQPFAGEAGLLMDNMLKALGLSRGHTVYLTTVIKCRPPGNRNPLPDEVAQCALYLHRQIELLQPKVILTMGKLAAQVLLRETLPEVDKLPPGKLRGQVHRYLPQGANRPLVATYPPAYLLRNPQEKARVWEDLVMAMESAKPGS